MNNLHIRTISQIGFLTLLILTGVIAHAQVTPRYQSEEVVVTASRIPTSHFGTARYVTVFDSTEIASLPGESVQSLFQYISGVDLRQRGPEGVQADIGIRGATFEQTLVLIDGVKMNDPQTGHHSLSLPVSRGDINRIEVMRGQGSSLYGPNAFGGVINIITKQGTEKNLRMAVSGGEHGLYEGDATFNYNVGSTANRFGFSRGHSDGYRPNTGFDVSKFSYRGDYLISGLPVRTFAGITDREFGANGFYSAQFPNQYEYVRTMFTTAGTSFRFLGVQVNPRVYWRRNYDDFILDNTRPEWYRNKHTTDVYGFEVHSFLETQLGMTAFGLEVAEERIESSNLGDHQRVRGGLFLEHRASLGERVDLDVGAFAYSHTGWGWEVWPGIGISYSLNNQWQAFVNFGQSYRIPTFTDLYYISPANLGNPDLQPENSRSYEIGVRTYSSWNRSGMSLFYRDGYNLIDWYRDAQDEPWQVQNVQNVDTYGFEATFEVFPAVIVRSTPITKGQIQYTYLSSRATESFQQSKYVSNYLRHQVIFGLRHHLPFGLQQQWNIRYNDRVNYKGYVLADARIWKQLNRFRVYLDVTNILDTNYREIQGVPLPGRWIKLGIESEISL